MGEWQEEKKSSVKGIAWSGREGRGLCSAEPEQHRPAPVTVSGFDNISINIE